MPPAKAPAPTAGGVIDLQVGMRSELALKEGIVACQPLRNSDIQTLDNEKMGIEGNKSA